MFMFYFASFFIKNKHFRHISRSHKWRVCCIRYMHATIVHTVYAAIIIHTFYLI